MIIIMKRIISVIITMIIMLTGCKGSQNEKKETQSTETKPTIETVISESEESEITALAEESEAPETADEEQTADQTVTSAPETSAPETSKQRETTAAQETAKPEQKETTAPETKAPETDPAHTHSYTVSVVSATCTKEGYTLHTCSCGKSYKDNTVKALGHDYEAATCQKPKTCKRCNATSGKAVAHSYVGGDCKTKSKCKYCGLEGSYGEHQYGKEVVTKKATYVEKGKKTKTCSVCGKKIEEEIPVRDAYELDDATFEKMVAERTLYYINQYRIAEGAPAAKSLPNMTKYAEYRAKQLVHNFAHDFDDEIEAATATKYGKCCYYDEKEQCLYIDEIVSPNDNVSYRYFASCGEAIGHEAQDRGNVDSTAKIFASGVHRSKNHWAYVGRPSNIYISIGYYFEAMDICTSDTDIYG